MSSAANNPSSKKRKSIDVLVLDTENDSATSTTTVLRGTIENPHLGLRNQIVVWGEDGAKKQVLFGTVKLQESGEIYVRLTSEKTLYDGKWVSRKVTHWDYKRGSWDFRAVVPGAKVQLGSVQWNAFWHNTDEAKATVNAQKRQLKLSFKECTTPLTAAMFGAAEDSVEEESSGEESDNETLEGIQQRIAAAKPESTTPSTTESAKQSADDSSGTDSGTDSEDDSKADGSSGEDSDEEESDTEVTGKRTLKGRQAVMSSDSEEESPAECGQAPAEPTPKEVKAMMNEMFKENDPDLLKLVRKKILAENKQKHLDRINHEYTVAMAAATEKQAAAVKAADDCFAAEQAKATAKRDRELAAAAGANAQAVKRKRTE